MTYQRQPLFGEIAQGEMRSNDFGRIAQWEWLKLEKPPVKLDAFCIMPNHIHGLLIIEDELPPPSSLSRLIGSYKSSVSRKIKLARGDNQPIWQPNHYEHILRSDSALDPTRHYILTNPLTWENDEENYPQSSKPAYN